MVIKLANIKCPVCDRHMTIKNFTLSPENRELGMDFSNGFTAICICGCEVTYNGISKIEIDLDMA